MKEPALGLPTEAMPAALRRFLYLTAATTGAAIMIIEILGAKMLAPYLGTSHFVWTAQIAVTLVALSAGYYVGGWQAQKAARLAWLYGSILAAALYLVGVTLVLRPVADWCLGFDLAIGSLLASTALFFLPLSLLATTSPFLARFLTASLADVGRSVGRLIAISTLGSFVGTLLIGYALIPLFRNSVTLLLTAASLAGIALLYFALWGRARLGPVALVLLLGLGGGGVGDRLDRTIGFRESKELHRVNSNFGELVVIEEPVRGVRYYLNDFLIQNTYDPAARQGVSDFTYLLHDLAQAYTPKLSRVLCIGLGIGLVPAEFARDGLEVDVVEINPAVMPVAKRFFDCPAGAFRLILADGRQFLNRATNHYDAIVLDAFLGDSSPSHLMSREAFAAMRRLLGPEGTLVINSFSDFHPGRDFLGASLDKTLRSVFRCVQIHSTGSGNAYFVASDRDPLEVLHAPDFSRVHPMRRNSVQAVFAASMRAHPDHGIVLTDDYNPVEFFDAANREEFRRSFARNVRAL